MAEVRARTFIQNTVERRSISYIPPNGRVLDTGAQVEVEGILETQLRLSADSEVLEEYLYDQQTGRIIITYDIDGVGLGGNASALTPDDQDLTPLTTALLNEQNTGIILSNSPVSGGTVHIFLNGIGPYSLGDGDKSRDFYFSDDGGVTAQAIVDIQVGDVLYYNALVAGFILDSIDRISFVEVVLAA